MTTPGSEAQVPDNLDSYRTIGVGPGIGTSRAAATALKALLEGYDRPMVLDADALNLLAQHPEWLTLLPKGSILTPHPKEFERLFGKTADSFERTRLQHRKAEELQAVILLKGRYTAIASPDGKVHFNSTGNPALATGGSGDVLTGLLTALLAQGYSPTDAAVLGTYLHGLAGDLGAEQLSVEGFTAGDIVEWLPKAWQALSSH